MAKYISSDEDLDAVEMHEPYTYLNGLTIDDLEDLLVDINVYRYFFYCYSDLQRIISNENFKTAF